MLRLSSSLLHNIFNKMSSFAFFLHLLSLSIYSTSYDPCKVLTGATREYPHAVIFLQPSIPPLHEHHLLLPLLLHPLLPHPTPPSLKLPLPIPLQITQMK